MWFEVDSKAGPGAHPRAVHMEYDTGTPAPHKVTLVSGSVTSEPDVTGKCHCLSLQKSNGPRMGQGGHSHAQEGSQEQGLLPSLVLVVYGRVGADGTFGGPESSANLLVAERLASLGSIQWPVGGPRLQHPHCQGLDYLPWRNVGWDCHGAFDWPPAGPLPFFFFFN